MGIAPSVDATLADSPSGMIDEQIGEAYGNVQVVAENIPLLATLSNQIATSEAAADASAIAALASKNAAALSEAAANDSAIAAANSEANAAASAASAAGEVDAAMASLAADNGATLVGYKRAETGAVARTTRDKLQDTINVKDFGAVGDGVTDDRSAIANAVAAARGRELRFPKGNYLINTAGGSIILEEVSLRAEDVLDGATAVLDQGANFLVVGTANNPFKVRRGVSIVGFGWSYPDQPDSAAPTAYPATLAFDFTNGAVQHVHINHNVVLNAYDFVDINDAGGNVGHVSINDNVIGALHLGVHVRHNAEHIRISGNNFTFGHWLAATEAGAAGYMRANATALKVDQSDGIEFIDNLVFGFLNGVLAAALGNAQMQKYALNKFDQVRYPVKAAGVGNFSGQIDSNTFTSFNNVDHALQGRSISIETTGAGYENIAINGNQFNMATDEHIYTSGDTATRDIIVGPQIFYSWAGYKAAGVYGALNINGSLTNLHLNGGKFTSTNSARTKGIVGAMNTAHIANATFNLTTAPVDIAAVTASLIGNRSYNTGGATSDIISATEIRSHANGWDKPSGAGKHAFVARSGAQTFNSATATDVALTSELLDTDNTFVSPSFTVKVPGLYQFNWILTHDATVTVGDRWNLALVVNGAALHDPSYRIDSAEVGSIAGSYMARLAAGNVVKLQMRRTGGTGQFALIAPALNANSFSGCLVN